MKWKERKKKGKASCDVYKHQMKSLPPRWIPSAVRTRPTLGGPSPYMCVCVCVPSFLLPIFLVFISPLLVLSPSLLGTALVVSCVVSFLTDAQSCSRQAEEGFASVSKAIPEKFECFGAALFLFGMSGESPTSTVVFCPF